MENLSSQLNDYWSRNSSPLSIREHANRLLHYYHDEDNRWYASSIRDAFDTSYANLDFLLSNLPYLEMDDSIYTPIRIAALVAKFGHFFQDQFLGLGATPGLNYLDGSFFKTLREMLITQFYQFNNANPNVSDFPMFFMNIFQELGLPVTFVDLYLLMEDNFLNVNMFNILRQTLGAASLCPPEDFLRF